MKRVCVIPCGVKKIWDVNPEAGSKPGETFLLKPAASAYEKLCSNIFVRRLVLSAKHDS
ncbi:hypothetical protein WAX46_12145 [Bacillus sp. FJAT-53060]|uniref:hypothetical protein n=1 Tax=Bacillus TaxID=1386 RepID=UPI001CFC0603|nr:hypothetical protein [Bacillus stratosphericus]